MKTVRQLLDSKGRNILSITSGATVYDALVVMADHHIGALVVIDNDKLVGIFSERDYARNIVLKGKDSKSTKVREIMSTQITTVTPLNDVEDCMTLMSDKRIRHLPVMDGDKVVGVLSIGDLVKETIAYQQFLISQLENYIRN